ncbi:MAG: hypothetical protein UU21_C0003G0039 [Candidatus Levybacteria bacterium GW2011_GWA2_40_8]|nr:MAG: hypothetical protein UU21_C0003G0039 [Candidatus Levybacteria bacterium GW2011_GWA2_40_8]
MGKDGLKTAPTEAVLEAATSGIESMIRASRTEARARFARLADFIEDCGLFEEISVGEGGRMRTQRLYPVTVLDDYFPSSDFFLINPEGKVFKTELPDGFERTLEKVEEVDKDWYAKNFKHAAEAVLWRLERASEGLKSAPTRGSQ